MAKQLNLISDMIKNDPRRKTVILVDFTQHKFNRYAHIPHLKEQLKDLIKFITEDSIIKEHVSGWFSLIFTCDPFDKDRLIPKDEVDYLMHPIICKNRHEYHKTVNSAYLEMYKFYDTNKPDIQTTYYPIESPKFELAVRTGVRLLLQSNNPESIYIIGFNGTTRTVNKTAQLVMSIMQEYNIKSNITSISINTWKQLQ